MSHACDFEVTMSCSWWTEEKSNRYESKVLIKEKECNEELVDKLDPCFTPSNEKIIELYS